MNPLFEQSDTMQFFRNARNVLTTLNRISQCVNFASDFKKLYNDIYRLVRKILPCDRFAILTYHAKEKSFDVIFAVGNGKKLSKLKLEIDRQLISQLPRTPKTIIINKTNSISDESRMASPILLPGQLVGAVYLQTNESEYFADHAQLLEIIASQMGAVLTRIVDSAYAKQDKPRRSSTKLLSVVKLANRVGHEMNQPLTGISGYCALIKEEIEEGNPIYKDLIQIEKQAKRLEQLVVKFQNISRHEGFNCNKKRPLANAN